MLINPPQVEPDFHTSLLRTRHQSRGRTHHQPCWSGRGGITDGVDALWDRTETQAGIDRAVFFDYFAGRDVGHGIVIGKVQRYKQPLDLQVAFGVRPPQSFLYL